MSRNRRSSSHEHGEDGVIEESSGNWSLSFRQAIRRWWWMLGLEHAACRRTTLTFRVRSNLNFEPYTLSRLANIRTRLNHGDYGGNDVGLAVFLPAFSAHGNPLRAC
jgi:hypothetical protein